MNDIELKAYARIFTARWKDGRWDLYGIQDPAYKPGDKIIYRHEGVTYHGVVLEAEITNLVPGYKILDYFFVWYRVQPDEIVHHHWVTESQIV